MAPIIGRLGWRISKRPCGWHQQARPRVEVYAKRLQIQEKMTAQIANSINDVLKPQGSQSSSSVASLHDDARRA